MLPVGRDNTGEGRGQRVLLEQYYRRLLAEIGPQGWWPARTRLEVILGAILVQNTSWENARQALTQLRKAGLLRLRVLRNATYSELQTCIHPAGFFRQKASTIRTFVSRLGHTYDWSLDRLFRRPPGELRQELLNLRGLGPETVDAILLYAGRQPFFVADAYTRRILARHELVPPTADYASVQRFLHQHLPSDQALFNEFHALLVEVGKRYCRSPAPRCEQCPLKTFLGKELPQNSGLGVQASALASPAPGP